MTPDRLTPSADRRFAAVFTVFCLCFWPLIALPQDASSEHVSGSGEVISINSGGRSITIRHGDIPTFMPAMQMTFPVSKPALVKDVKAGDRVDFVLRRRNGTIEKIQSSRIAR